MTQPHPKRCETCTNDECDFNEDRWGPTWHNDIYYFMKKCGCASHSSASEPVPVSCAGCIHDNQTTCAMKDNKGHGCRYYHDYRVPILPKPVEKEGDTYWEGYYKGCKQEREKVLDAIEKKISFCPDRARCIVARLESLRQQGGKR